MLTVIAGAAAALFLFFPMSSAVSAVYGLYSGDELVCCLGSAEAYRRAADLAGEIIYSEKGIITDFGGYTLLRFGRGGAPSAGVSTAAECADILVSRINTDEIDALVLKIDGVPVGFCESEAVVRGCIETLEKEENDYTASCIRALGRISAKVISDISLEPSKTEIGNLMGRDSLLEYLRSVKECDYVWLGEFKNMLNADSEKVNASENADLDTPRYIEKEDRADMEAAGTDEPDTGYDGTVHSWAVCERSASESLIRFSYTCKQAAIVSTPRRVVYRYTDDRLVGYELVMKEGSDGLALTEKTSVFEAGKLLSEESADAVVISPHEEKIVIVGTRKQGEAGETYGSFMWPVFYDEDPLITSYYGSRRPQFDGGGYHLGIDIFVPIGTDVYASDGGTVSCAEYIGSYGNMIIIDHDGELQSVYAHLSEMYVGVGDKVCGGQLIGLSGDTGQVSAGHLHFEIRLKLHTIDPFKYLPDYWPPEDGDESKEKQ